MRWLCAPPSWAALQRGCPGAPRSHSMFQEAAVAELAGLWRAEPDAAEGSKGCWRLVWVHERCHKHENIERVRAIGRELHSLGAALICLKKANQFSLWVQQAARPPFILVTDWREAQPCMQFLTQQASSNQPVGTVVVCDSTRQLGRASEWAQGLPQWAGPVATCERGRVPPTLLDGLIFRHFSSAHGDTLQLPHPPGLGRPEALVEKQVPGPLSDGTEEAGSEENSGSVPWLSEVPAEEVTAHRQLPFYAAATKCPATNMTPVKLIRECDGRLAIAEFQ